MNQSWMFIDKAKEMGQTQISREWKNIFFINVSRILTAWMHGCQSLYVPPSTINACVVDLNVQSVQMLLYALSVLNVHNYECVCEWVSGRAIGNGVFVIKCSSGRCVRSCLSLTQYSSTSSCPTIPYKPHPSSYSQSALVIIRFSASFPTPWDPALGIRPGSCQRFHTSLLWLDEILLCTLYINVPSLSPGSWLDQRHVRECFGGRAKPNCCFKSTTSH